MKLSPSVIVRDITSKQLTIITVALLQIIFGIVTLVCNESIFNKLLTEQLVVKEGTRAFEAWKESPIPAYTKFYMFSMVNGDDYIKNNAKPIIEEKGPYTFRETQQKVNLVWHDDGTISYNRRKFWHFEPSMSAGPLTDTVISLNLPMVTAVNYARENFMMEFGLSDMLATVEAQLFLNKTVGELLFDGYDDPILEIGASFDEEQKTMPTDKFAWFYKRNGTSWADGQLRMHTGEGDISRLGDIVTWNGKNRTHAYPGPCGQLSGSADGLLTPGKLMYGDRFDMWSTDICRKLTFERIGKTTRHGISVQKFSLSDQIFDNGTVCKENKCYHNDLPTGVQNVSTCKMKAPAYLSRPHFEKADGFYARQFQIGIHPETSQRDSYFLIEPHTSIPLEVKLSMQLNVKIERSEGMEYIFQNLTSVYFPCLWFETSVELPDHMASALQLLVNIPSLMVAASILGILAGIVGIVCVWRNILRDQADTLPGGEKRPGPWEEKLDYVKKVFTYKNLKKVSLKEDSTG